MEKKNGFFCLVVTAALFGLSLQSCADRMEGADEVMPVTEVEESAVPDDGEEILFSIGAGTKAVTPVTRENLDGFWVSATASSTGSERMRWENAKFEDRDGDRVFTGGKVWPRVDLGYSFYASNVEMRTGTDGLPAVRIDGVTDDVICAYLPKDDARYGEGNALVFEHILVRVEQIDLGVLMPEGPYGGFGNIVFEMQYRDSGTYDIATGEWSSLGGLKTAVLNPEGDNGLWFIPGVYQCSLSFDDKLGRRVSRSGSVDLSGCAGLINKPVITFTERRIDFGGDLQGRLSEMYLAQTQTLTLDLENVRGEDLHWSVLSGEDCVSLSAATGNGVTLSCHGAGEAVLYVTDGIATQVCTTHVYKPRMEFEADRADLGADGKPLDLAYDYLDIHGGVLARDGFDDELFVRYLLPSVAVEDRVGDFLGLNAPSGGEGDEGCSAYIATLRGLRDYSIGYSENIRTFASESMAVGRIRVTNPNLFGGSGSGDSVPAYLLLPKVKWVDEAALQFNNRIRCGGEIEYRTSQYAGFHEGSMFYSAPFVSLSNAGRSGLRIPTVLFYPTWVEEEVELSLQVHTSQDGGVRIGIGDESAKMLVGTLDVGLFCRNKNDRSEFYIIEDASMQMSVVEFLGVKLLLRSNAGVWYIVPTAWDGNTDGYLYDEGNEDYNVLYEFIDWNSDTEFMESYPDIIDESNKLYRRFPGQLGAALNLTALLQWYTVTGLVLEEGRRFYPSDHNLVTQGGEQESFSLAFKPEIKYEDIYGVIRWIPYNSEGITIEDTKGCENLRFVNMFER